MKLLYIDLAGFSNFIGVYFINLWVVILKINIRLEIETKIMSLYSRLVVLSDSMCFQHEKSWGHFIKIAKLPSL